MREEIIKAANALIFLLMECGDENLVDTVTSAVMYASPIFDNESEGADDD